MKFMRIYKDSAGRKRKMLLKYPFCLLYTNSRGLGANKFLSGHSIESMSKPGWYFLVPCDKFCWFRWHDLWPVAWFWPGLGLASDRGARRWQWAFHRPGCTSPGGCIWRGSWVGSPRRASPSPESRRRRSHQVNTFWLLHHKWPRF